LPISPNRREEDRRTSRGGDALQINSGALFR
jgi:hypothetical protein